MAAEQSNVLLHAAGVRMHFKGKNRRSGTVKAVDGITFDIMKGETFGVVGESGCGKSTLGRLLIRLLDPTEGEIYLEGEDISRLQGGALKQMRKKRRSPCTIKSIFILSQTISSPI